MAGMYSIAPGESPEDTAYRRKYAYALLKGDDKPIQHWAQGAGRMAEALMGGLELRRMDEESKAERAAARDLYSSFLLPGGGTNPIPPGVTPTQPSSPPPLSAPSSVPMAGGPITSPQSAPVKDAYSPDEQSPLDPVPGAITPDRAQFLAALKPGEGGGRSNVMYGGKTFDSFADHPRQPQPIRTGPNAGKTSSAAGDYQFIAPTWDRAKMALGLQDFSPESQNAAAVYTAGRDYETRTGQNFDRALEEARGDPAKTQAIARALAPTWTSLPGGIEPNTETNKFVGRMMQRPQDTAAAPTQALAFNGQPSTATDAPMPGMAPKPAATNVAQAPAAPAQPGGVNREALIKMLGNRHTAPMAQAIIGKQLENQFKPEEWDIKNNADGSITAVSKRNPQNVQTITPPGANERALKFETDKALATKKASEVGEAEGKASVALPEALTAAQDALKVITKAKTHPGIDRGTGVMGAFPSMPGSAAKDFDVLNDQLRGKAFVQAFEKLKGGGAISEKEGEAATAAIARLNQSQSKEAYLEALGELETIIGIGVRNAQIKAGKAPAAAPRADADALKKKYGLQ